MIVAAGLRLAFTKQRGIGSSTGHAVVVMLLLRMRIVLLPLVVLIYGILLGVAVIDVKRSLQDEETMAASMTHKDLPIPAGIPRMSQDSLYQAISIYNIRIPHGVTFPEYDAELQDRGLTSLNPWTKKFTVKIGPAAFQSWSLLGSTLAHEFEVHCNQSFLWIHMQDLVGMEGTNQAEREAYAYELKNADRFGLNQGEVAMIQETVDYYYPIMAPDKAPENLSARMKTFFDLDAP